MLRAQGDLVSYKKDKKKDGGGEKDVCVVIGNRIKQLVEKDDKGLRSKIFQETLDGVNSQFELFSLSEDCVQRIKTQLDSKKYDVVHLNNEPLKKRYWDSGPGVRFREPSSAYFVVTSLTAKEEKETKKEIKGYFSVTAGSPQLQFWSSRLFF